MKRIELLKEMESERKKIQNSAKRLGELQAELDKCDMEEWDWISVPTASKLINVNVQSIYNKINKAELRVKYFGAKMFVSKKEILNLNDSYECK